MQQTLGDPSNWIVEWKFDGIRAQLIRRGEGWRLWSRGEELISDGYPDLEPLARALPTGSALDGELVVMVPPENEASPHSLQGLAPFASLQRRLGRKVVSEKTMRELPVAFIAYDLLELDGRDMRALPQRERRAALERLVQSVFDAATARRERLPLRVSPTVAAETWEALDAVRLASRALGREGLMLKAREGAYGVGRRKGDDRTDVWWKWKVDPMSVDAVLIYAQRGHGRRSGVYSDYTFAVWSTGEDAPQRELIPFAKAYSGLSDAEMREMDAIIRAHDGRDLRAGAQREADPGVRARLRGHRAEQTPSERDRGPLPQNAALAARQAGRRGGHARRLAGAVADAGQRLNEAVFLQLFRVTRSKRGA